MPGHGRSRLVAVRLPAGEAFLAVLGVIWAAGEAILPVDPALPAPALGRMLEELRPAAIVDEHGRHALPGGAGVDPDVAVVIATSGSGGRPKGVELDHAALAASARATAGRIGSEPGDRWLCCLPPHHIAGFQVVARAHHAGAGLELHPRFDVAAVAASDATLTSLVPTMLRRLLEAGVDLSRFRRILVGGAAVPAALGERAQRAGARLAVTYGMTETCGGCVYDGFPLDGVRVRIDAEGRIRIHGPMLLHGYRDRSAAAAGGLVDGWFVTSDLGRLDEHGRLEVLGRADRVIVTGGSNVVAEHVEAVLAAHPRVAESVVIGRPDPEWGQLVVAVVVPSDPEDPPSLAELRAHVGARAPAYAAPRSVEVVPALPLLATGKVDHAAVVRRHGRHLAG
jgi:O-succinylbenzoic acid--CoA ligase